MAIARHATGAKNIIAMGALWASIFPAAFLALLVPDEKYCLDAGAIEPGLASTYMCSGITAYSALKHLKPVAADDQILIVGLGGVGMMALQFALQMFEKPPLVADLDENKLQAAMGAGAAAAYNPNQLP